LAEIGKIERLPRLLCVIAVGAITMLQSATVMAAPSPTPSLDGILLAPPGTGFVEAALSTPGIFEGPFDSAGYADITASADAANAKQTLDLDGFLSGFGRSWVSPSGDHGYIEAVMAFAGAKGAKTWLSQSELASKAQIAYQHAITISGIGTYYGARLADATSSVFADQYFFIKGNDTFIVSTISLADDLATTAAIQAKRQYDSAPPYSVPPAQWPESKTSNLALNAAKLNGAAVAGILIVGLIVTTLLIARSRRRPPLQGGRVGEESEPDPSTPNVDD
jgi:hypothetical protein